MNESFEYLRPMRFRQRTARRRDGMFVLELILILPIILLVFVLLYQVSVMMTTYQALRLTVFNASEAFAQNQNQTIVAQTIQSAIQGYYFGNAAVVQATSSNWATTPDNTASVKYRLLYSTDSGTSWHYYTGTPLANGNLIAVELKLENAENVYKRYWLLSRFANVPAVQSGSMVLSQITAPKVTP